MFVDTQRTVSVGNKYIQHTEPALHVETETTGAGAAHALRSVRLARSAQRTRVAQQRLTSNTFERACSGGRGRCCDCHSALRAEILRSEATLTAQKTWHIAGNGELVEAKIANHFSIGCFYVFVRTPDKKSVK